MSDDDATWDDIEDFGSGPLPTNDESEEERFDSPYGFERIRTPDLSEIVFPRDEDGDRPVPATRELARRLDRDRLTVFGGEASDKRGIARRCAWEFAEERMDAADGVGARIPPIELRQTMDARDLVRALDDALEASVFVLSDVEPHQLSRVFDSVFKRSTHRHWILVTTDRPLEAWRTYPEIEDHWVEPVESELYPSGRLERYLVAELDPDVARSLPLEEPLGSLRHLAEALGSPDGIDYFCRELRRHGPVSALEPDVVADLVARSNSSGNRIDSWFHVQLTDRERVVTIALALLADADEDLAFEAVEHLLKGAWKERDPTFRFIDYADLVNLRSHVSFAADEHGRRRVLLAGDDKRHLVFRTAWSTHRRQILAALGELVALVRRMEGEPDGRPSVISTRRKCRTLRQCVGEALGDVGRLSLPAIEDQLLFLVSTNRLESQRVAAEALARVRAMSDGRTILDMLDRWRGGSELRRLLRFLSGSAADDDSIDEAIGGSVAIVLGRLAVHDPSSQIDERITDMIVSYAASGRIGVLSRLSLETLRMLVPLHLGQMTSLLDRIVDNVLDNRVGVDRVSYGIALGIGLALRGGGREASALATRWIAAGSRSSVGVDPENMTADEFRQAAGILALGTLRAPSSQESVAERHDGRGTLVGPDRVEVAFGMIRDVLERGGHPFVRTCAIDALLELLRRETRALEDGTQRLIALTSPEERRRVTRSLIEVHRRQRSAQTGGDAFVRIEGRLYPVWYDADPPETDIQKLAVRWGTNGVEQIAAYAPELLAAIDESTEAAQKRERERLLTARDAERSRREALAEKMPRYRTTERKAPWLTRRVFVPLLTLHRPSIRQSVTGNVATMIGQPAGARADTLKRYEDSDRGVANAVRRALWCAERVPLVVASVVAIGGIALLAHANR